MVKGQQPKKFDCGTMLVKVSKEVDEEEAYHPTLPMDRTANWCSHGGPHGGSLWPTRSTALKFDGGV